MRSACLLLLSLATMIGLGCSDLDSGADDASNESETSIPFRKDGELTFLTSGDDILSIDIEIADTDSARQRGMMQRDSLPSRAGMLFIFPREEMQSFWMANTPLSLDLIFIDADSQIVDIEKYTRPFSTRSIASAEPARYVLEVRAGFCDTYGITEGLFVRWRRGAGGR